MKKPLLLLLFLLPLFAACRQGVVCHRYCSIPDEGWDSSDTLCFDVGMKDSLGHYALSVEVRNRNDYPYRNLGLRLLLSLPCGKDTLSPVLPPQETEYRLNLTLADTLGNWNGSGCGGLYSSSFPVSRFTVGHAGICRIRIVSDMPDEVLKGINDIGIKIVIEEGK